MSTVSLPSVGVAHQATRRERLALRTLQVGAVLSVAVSSTYPVFDLDRFFVPKELVLHLTALLCGALLLPSIRRVAATRVDLVLAGFLVASLLSTALATNVWAGMRALAISVSGVAIRWSAGATVCWA